MVILGSHDGKPGRYWGEGQGPSATPSQASILLARINSRARERKAGMVQGRGGVKGRKGEPGDGGAHKPTTYIIQEALDINEGKDTTQDIEVEGKVNGLRTAEDHVEEEIKDRKGKKSQGDERKGAIEPCELPLTERERPSSAEREVDLSPVVKKKKKKKRRDEEEPPKEQQEQGISESAEGDSVKKRRPEEEDIGVEREKSETKVKRKKHGHELINGERTDELSETSEYKIKKKKRKDKGENQDGVDEDMKEALLLNTTEEEEANLELRKKKRKKEKGENQGVIDEENKGTPGTPLFSTTREEEHEINLEVRKKKKRKEKGEENQGVVMDEKNEETLLLNTKQEEEDETNLSSPRKKKKKKKVEMEEEEGDEAKSDESVPSLKVPKIKEEMEAKDQNESQEEIEVKGNEENAEGVKRDKKKRKKNKDKLKKKEKLKNKMEVGGFTLLTEVEATRRQKVQRTLPHWLANPTVIGRDLLTDGTSVDSLRGLDPSLVDLLKKNKINQLFPVQKALIPEILAGSGPLACRFRPRDVCVSAPTGSGKTLAYVLPLIQALKTRTVPRIRALVLLPVQELANQVYHVFLSYCKGSSLHVGRAIGHSTMQKEQSTLVIHHLDTYHSLVDILVATPGRLADHIRMTQGLDLSAVRYLVLDEADRMLAAEGGDWVAHVQRTITDHQAKQQHWSKYEPPVQRLLFSATLSSDPEQLQHVTLYHPKLFSVAPPSAGQDKSVAVVMGQYVRPAELKEEFVLVEEEVKPLALHHLLVSGEGRRRVLVFTNSVHATHKLALLLAILSEGSGKIVAEFSSKRDKRQQILSQFAAGKIDVLVSSDAMARGLDVPDIDHVVSYDVTATATYVHRIGRTARAGQPGTALSIVTKSTLTEFRRALSGGGEGASQLTLTSEELEPYEQQYIDALAHMKKILEEEERQKRLNHPNGKAKKKKNQRQKLRKQKKDMRIANRIAKKKAEGKDHPSFNTNRLRHHTRP